jgi:ABC-2 type transport system ATP-binding protein
MGNVIEVIHAEKVFQDGKVLHDINLTMEEGKIYGLIGRNGSGKTVLMKCICGFLHLTSGEIRVLGQKVGVGVDFPDSIGAIIETPGFLNYLTGYQNLEILAEINHRITKETIQKTMQMVGLPYQLKKKTGKYSLGMRQRLGIAQAIMEDPKILILDEPFNGLDKEGVEEVRALLLEFKEKGKTILLSSHMKEDIEILCDEVYEMDRGELTAL